jgi:hypothetical protein
LVTKEIAAVCVSFFKNKEIKKEFKNFISYKTINSNLIAILKKPYNNIKQILS